MNRVEHLLSIIVAEECCEVGSARQQGAFDSAGQEVQPGDERTNADRIMEEYHDLQAAVAMLQDEGVLPVVPNGIVVERILAKRAKVEKFLA
jgi:hypothetical protein